jgi:hypothetical protein
VAGWGGDPGLMVRVNRLHFHNRSVTSGCGAERLPFSRSTEAGNGVWRDRGRVSVPAITGGCSWDSWVVVRIGTGGRKCRCVGADTATQILECNGDYAHIERDSPGDKPVWRGPILGMPLNLRSMSALACWHELRFSPHQRQFQTIPLGRTAPNADGMCVRSKGLD